MTAPTRAGPAADIFIDAASPRLRRPLDVAVTVGGLLVGVLAALASDEQGALDRAAAFPARLPGWAINLLEAAYVVCACYVIALAVVLLVSPRKRAAQLLSATIAAGTAVALASAGSLIVRGELPEGGFGPSGRTPDDQFPVLWLAVMVAVLLALRQWMVIFFRRLDAVLAAAVCVFAWLIGVGDPPAVLGAAGVGAVAAGVALLGMGSPGGYPRLVDVSASLDDLGLRVQGLRFAERQPRGARLLHGTDSSGAPLLVKVYGRDASDAQRGARWWRAIAYREPTMPGASRLQMVEHEALVTLLAERAGAGVTRVLAAAASRGDAVIVLGAPPTPFSELDEQLLDDDALREIWCVVARLHDAGLAHGDLGLHTVGPEQGRIVVSDFAHGTVASSPAQLAQDTATLLTSQALRVGPARTVVAALDGLSRDAVVGAQPYLQRPALPRHLRASPGLKSVLAGLSAEISVRTGIPPARPAPLVRVRWLDVARAALLFVAAYSLVTILAQLDWAVVFQSWAEASWAWIMIGLLVAQLTSVADSVSTMSAVPTRLPLLPLVHLQYAVKFVGLAISATAGRIALNTALLRKFGQGPSVAVTASALDTGAGALVNVVVVAVALYVGGGTGSLTLDTPGLARTVGVLVAVVVVSLVVVAIVRPLRRRALAILRSMWAALRVVGASPARASVLVGSNLVSLLITAAAMACMVRAIHPSLEYGTVLAVTAGAAFLSSIVPVPGNIGVGEATITVGLTMAGIPPSAAFAIAVTQRIATSYLPSVVGAPSLRWLRREEYV